MPTIHLATRAHLLCSTDFLQPASSMSVLVSLSSFTFTIKVLCPSQAMTILLPHLMIIQTVCHSQLIFCIIIVKSLSHFPIFQLCSIHCSSHGSFCQCQQNRFLQTAIILHLSIQQLTITLEISHSLLLSPMFGMMMTVPLMCFSN